MDAAAATIGPIAFPRIVEAASRLRTPSFLIDGEAVVCRDDGISDFDALRSRRHDDDVTLIAFDLIELQRDDLRNHKLIDQFLISQIVALQLDQVDAICVTS